MEDIEFIHSLYHSYEFDKYSNLLAFAQSNYLYDINLLKYLIENNIIGETYPNDNQYYGSNGGSILHILIKYLPKLSCANLKLSTKEKFKRFNECFEYFLDRGNDINANESFLLNIYQYYTNYISFIAYEFRFIDEVFLWIIIKYLIDKGSDLLYKSKTSLLKTHFFLNDKGEKIRKYLNIRSFEINEKSSAQRSMTQYIQHSKIQNNNKDSLLIYNNEKEMKEEWKRVFSSFVLSPPLILN